jgi:hypothetical protein
MLAINSPRWPRGYAGIHHKTIGSDLLSVVGALQSLTGSERRVAAVIGTDEVKRLAAVQPDGWYPVEWLLELLELIEARMGRFGLLRVGRTVFELSHASRLRGVATSGRDVVAGIDAMYRHANRGQAIGGWQVISFDDHRAELEKTTPHHCAMEEGILIQALEAVGAPSLVTQTACFREGADACRFVITPVTLKGRWNPVM